MKNNYLFLVFLAVFSHQLFSQDSIPRKWPNTYNFGNYTLGTQFFSPSAASAVGNGIDYKVGYELAMRFYLPINVGLGAYYSKARGEVRDVAAIGSYDNTSTSYIAFVVGYRYFITKKLTIEADAMYGYVKYKNRKAGQRNFRDDGNAFTIRPELSFTPTRNLSLYAAYNWRYDFLRIKTTAEKDDYLNRIQYTNLSLGIRLELDTIKN